MKTLYQILYRLTGRSGKILLAGMILSLGALFFASAIMLIAPASAAAFVSLSVTIAPPPLPVYSQPICPGPGFIWVPGYWAWDPDYGYYWVPGLWAPAPFIGALWTPGYWGWDNGAYLWYDGYWGTTIGFYGGINYGFGYTGYGYYGGYWSGGSYYYNTTVNNVNVTNITNVYNKPVPRRDPSGASFNGGKGGTAARPTPEQEKAAHEKHYSPTNEQRHQAEAARSDPRQRISTNHGRPPVAASVKPGEFTGHGVMPATRTSIPYKAPSNVKAEPREQRGASRPAAPEHQRSSSPAYQQPRSQERPTPSYSTREPERRASRPPVQEREQGYTRAPSQHQRPQEYNRAPAPNQRQQEYNRAPAPNQRQQEYNRAPSQSQRPQEYNRAPAPNQRQQEYNRAPAQHQKPQQAAPVQRHDNTAGENRESR